MRLLEHLKDKKFYFIKKNWQKHLTFNIFYDIGISEIGAGYARNTLSEMQ